MTTIDQPPLNEDQWLLRHARNVHSIAGEDGIIGKIFETIPPENRWCVEFGAWDGKTYSNTHHLMQNGWSGVFVEADSARFKDLVKNYQNTPSAHCLNCFVTFEGENSLDSLLARTPIPKNFDLLSIDIDGNDYHVWQSLVQYRPRVVIIEFNNTIPSHVEFIQPRDMGVHQGSAPLSLVKLGREKGYELVCVTEHNVIFVQAPLLAAFHISDNALSRLRLPSPIEFHLFQLYDGTFVTGGPDVMPWHGLPVRPGQFQVLPKMFRVFPSESLGVFKKVLRRVWRFFYLNRAG
jgi:hypothetical protein